MANLVKDILKRMGLARVVRRRSRGILWLLAVYASLLAVNPILHDDLACHLKSPTHCSACTASPSASRIEVVGATLPVPVEAGRVETSDHAAETVTPLLALAGRSPPA
jgi:hypothetical protein